LKIGLLLYCQNAFAAAKLEEFLRVVGDTWVCPTKDELVSRL
jgi:hypothetical protein